MTVSSETNQNLHAGNDVATVFPYTFKILDASHVRVVLADADDVETLLTLNVDYSVSGVGDDAGGNVTLIGIIPATGETLSIRRLMPILQLLDLLNQGDLNAENLEEAYDYAIMVLQQQQNELDRAVKVAETSGLSGDDILGLIDDAVTAAQAAQTAAEAAQTAAETAQTGAETAETGAQTAETGALAAQTAAEAAQTAAEAAQAAAEAAILNVIYDAVISSGGETYATHTDWAAYLADSPQDNDRILVKTGETINSTIVIANNGLRIDHDPGVTYIKGTQSKGISVTGNYNMIKEPRFLNFSGGSDYGLQVESGATGNRIRDARYNNCPNFINDLGTDTSEQGAVNETP